MPTLVRMDNSIAHGLITQSMITKALKFIEMDSIIIECIGAQIKFNLLRWPVTHNRAYYYTRHHPQSHFFKKRKDYLIYADLSPK